MPYGRVFVTTAAMICIVTLEGLAIANGINGAGLAAALALLAGLGGYAVAKKRQSS